MSPPGGSGPRGLASIRSLGVVDGLEVNFLGLEPKTRYGLYVTSTARPPYREQRHVADVMTNPRGGAIGQAVGPLRELVEPSSAPASAGTRYLVLLPAGNTGAPPVLVGTVAAAR